MSGSCIPESWRQIVVTLIANMLSIYMGVFFGWTIVNCPLAIVKKNGSEEISIDMEAMAEDLSIISAALRLILFVCILVVLIATIHLSERYGRRTALGVTTLPFVLYSAARASTDAGIGLEPSRIFFIIFCGGIASAMQLYLVPIYVYEISSSDRRGAHGVVRILFIGIGMYFGYVKTEIWLEYVPILGQLVLPVIYLIATRLLPESPVWLAKNGRMLEAQRVTAWLGKKDVSLTRQEIARLFDEAVDDTESIGFIEMFRSSDVRKGLTVINLLLIGQALIQINCVVAYFIITKIWIISMGLPNGAIALNVIMHIMTCILTAMTIDRVGRRKLLLISCTGMILTLSIIGGCRPMLDDNFSNPQGVIMFTVSLGTIGYMIFYYLGIGTIPTIAALEIIPDNVIHYGYAVTLAIFWITTWIVAGCWETILSAIGVSYWCSLQVAVCILLLIVIWIMPETKAKAVIEETAVPS